MTAIQAHIINMERNPDRMVAMRNAFDPLGIKYERFAASDASQLSADDAASFRNARPQNNKENPWDHIGQIGCFLSHYGLWQKAAESSNPYTAIFEDDMHISPAIADFLKDDSWIPAGCNIIRLETSTNRVLFNKAPLGTHLNRTILHVQSTTWCAGGYIISRECAKRLIAMTPSKHSPTDDMLFCFESMGVANELKIAQIFPALCVQDKFFHADAKDVQFQSNIEDGSMMEARKSRLQFLFKRSPLELIKKTIMGYKRIPFAA